jgi:hypothetical protein
MTQTTPPEDLASFYRRAFQEFGAMALWSSRPGPESNARRRTGNHAQPSRRR